MDIYDYGVFWGDGTRDIFSMNKNLASWIIENVDVAKKKDNLIHNLQREIMVNKSLTQKDLIGRVTLLQDKFSLLSEKYQKMLLVENTDFDNKTISRSVVIYGCGDIGRALYKRLKQKCRILFFIDSYLRETEFDGVPVIKPNVGMKIDEKAMIVITVHDFEETAGLLQEIYGFNSSIVSLEAFCQSAVGKGK